MRSCDLDAKLDWIRCTHTELMDRSCEHAYLQVRRLSVLTVHHKRQRADIALAYAVVKHGR
jgi:hypothetical protein